MRWSGSNLAPKVTRTTCRYRCGTNVDAFVDTETGLIRQLNTEPVPITWDLKHPSIRRRLWEHRGDVIGWCQMWQPTRGWREVRLAHQCENTPKRKQESKRKHEKENNA